MRSGNTGAPARAVQSNADAFPMLFDAEALGVQPDLDALAGKDFGNGVGDFRVLAPDQAWSHLDNGNLAAEAAIHLRELQPNIAAADNHEMIGQEIDRHHRAVVQSPDRVEAGHVGRGGAAADIDEDTLRRMLLAVHADFARAGEACMAFIDRAIVHPLHPVLNAAARFLRHRVLARFDPFHVGPDFSRQAISPNSSARSAMCAA